MTLFGIFCGISGVLLLWLKNEGEEIPELDNENRSNSGISKPEVQSFHTVTELSERFKYN